MKRLGNFDPAELDRGVTVTAPIDVVEWLGDEQAAYVTHEAPAEVCEQLAELERELDSESTRPTQHAPVRPVER